MIELKGITKKYKTSNNKQYALKNVNIKFNKIGLIFILGNENSGKSTFLNIMGGLDTPSEGEIIVNGKSTVSFSKDELDYYRNTYVSFVFKDNNLLENETISKNINLSLDLQEKKLGKGELRRILNFVGLNNISENELVKNLTIGQKQIVAIARAIVKNPYVVLVDEPVKNVDIVTGRHIFDLLKKLSKNKLVIVFTRDSEIANRYSDRIFYIKEGVVVDDSKVEIITPVVENFGLVKSTVPFIDNIKYGINNLFHKKIKLLFTLLIFVIFLLCCGIFFSKTTYDLENEHIKGMTKNNENEIKIIKYDDIYDKKEQFNSMLTFNYLKFTKNNVKKTYLNNKDVSNIITNDKWIKEYKITQNLKNPLINFPNSINKDILYYTDNIEINFVTEDFKYNIIGRKPENNNEAIISKYVADQIIKNGILLKDSYNVYLPKDYNQIINDQKDVVISNLGSIKIVGIKDDNLEKYEPLKSVLYEDNYKDKINLFNNLLYDINNKYNRIYVLNSYINNLNLMENNLFYKTSKIRGKSNINLVYNFGFISNHEDINTKDGIININDVNDNEIVISYDLLDKITDGAYQLRLDEYIKNNPSCNDDDINDFTHNFLGERDLMVYTNVSNNTVKGMPNRRYKVMGVLMNKNIVKTTYYNKSNIIDLIPKSIEINSIYTNSNNIKNILDKYPIDESSIVTMTKYSKGIINASIISYIFSLTTKYGIIAFGIISVLLFINYLKDSISYSKKDINVYRTLGCRSKDISKMFIIECILFSIISILISNYFINYILNYFNNTVNNTLNNYTVYYDYNIINKIIIIVIGLLIPLVLSIPIINKFNRTKIMNLNKKR